jgi:hypothetical protein
MEQISMTIGIPFGDPRHPFRQTTETATKAAKIARKVSPWGSGPMCSGKRAAEIFVANKRTLIKQSE